MYWISRDKKRAAGHNSRILLKGLCELGIPILYTATGPGGLIIRDVPFDALKELLDPTFVANGWGSLTAKQYYRKLGKWRARAKLKTPRP